MTRRKKPTAGQLLLGTGVGIAALWGLSKWWASQNAPTSGGTSGGTSTPPVLNGPKNRPSPGDTFLG